MHQKNLLLYILLIFNSLYANCTSTTETPTTDGPLISEHVLGGEPYKWVPGDRHYPRSNQSVTVKTDPGYIISVAITKCDIDSQSGDYLQINSGSVTSNKEARVFTYELKETHKYLYHTNEVTAAVFVNQTSKDHNNKTGLAITFTRLNEIMTTTAPPPTTTPPHPTTSKGESAAYEVDVFGHSDVDYKTKEVLGCFEDALLNMTVDFCKANNIIPRDNITLENIIIDDLYKCPYSWPNSDKCVRVVFEIPIFLSEESPIQGYQLTTNNLKLMWESLAEGYLSKCELSPYKEPDVSNAIKWWLIVTLSVVVCFVILLCVVKRGCIKWSRIKRKRRLSDTATIISHKSEAGSSMEPHYMQIIPPLFDNMFQLFNPEEHTYSDPIQIRERTYDAPTEIAENFIQGNNRVTLTQDRNEEETEDAFV